MNAASGQGQGPWTDIYGVSATLYRLLVGRPPLDAVSRYMDEHQFEPISKTLKGRYSHQFLEALDWGMQVHAIDRPQRIADWRGPLLEGYSLAQTGHTASQTGLEFLTNDDAKQSMFGRLRDKFYRGRAPPDKTPRW